MQTTKYLAYFFQKMDSGNPSRLPAVRGNGIVYKADHRWIATLARSKQRHLCMNTSTMQTEHPSLGERLTPYLMAALEACLIDAIIIGLDGFNVFQVNEPLMPLWMPFVLMVGTLWLLRTFAQPISTNIMIFVQIGRE